MQKPNCYKCAFRQDVPGSAHSSCIVGCGSASPILAWVAFTKMPDKDIGVKGNPHGIANDWCNWPIDFDPTWIEECKYFREVKQGVNNG